MEQPNTQLTEEDIERFLSLNPRFFHGREKLLRSMRIPHVSGKAVSLLERQNALLREDIAELNQRLETLISHAHENDRLFNRLRSLVLELMVVSSLPQLAEQLHLHLTRHFNVDEVRLLLSTPGTTHAPWIAPLPEAETLGTHNDLLSQSKAVCGTFDQPLTQLLLGPDTQSQSLAMASIHYDQCYGLLVLGSTQKDYFRNSMDTLFLTYLSDVTARVLAHLSNQ
ncbi:DUF484 family protein [Gynuella sunshinyii]|uniref:DUF484 domain-containing protein n=1 Tax=Gynuella sunshinyii YC6258 TaxID=1445510 RepID=A0A0C5V0R9_9GAMM|nr:DUF484 family protein [Gynuella sunshinyii]AJQ93140.1 hypothetical protein YC6258_01092 [Gynuella sunshinyii YC6258]